MAEKGFRSFLDDLDAAGELKRITKPVDCRQLSALGEQADHATMFENIEGYPGWRVATALVSTRKRLAVAMGCTENRVAFEFEAKSARPIDPVTVENAPCQEVVMEGDDVDVRRVLQQPAGRPEGALGGGGVNIVPLRHEDGDRDGHLPRHAGRSAPTSCASGSLQGAPDGALPRARCGKSKLTSAPSLP